ncbi:brp/Blh family beta-carotene 15%2C15'-monooxygenase [Streptococcus pneumoniae]|nr:brp/Blh family beta-carotene 15%2C15'-monooxygenase [Streptococcus pneumoniae]
MHTNPQTFFLSFLLFVVFLVAQKSLFKTIAIVRQFDLEFFATPKDVLNYINSYDEGQLLAFLLVGAIHVYINVMQLPMVKRYFK